MTRRKTSKHDLSSAADLLGKRLSTATVLFHAAVASRMGVSVTDAKCRSLLLQHGPMTAGELAAKLGLTTGAVTGVIDRLEAARLVRRNDDPADRRRVVVVPVNEPKRDREMAQLFSPLEKRVKARLSSYSERDRQLIEDFLTSVSQILEEETVRLRSKRPPRTAG